jgi:hypothetical protein
VAIVFSVAADREGCPVRTDWEPDELIGAWTLVEGDWELIANKTGVTRLGLALLLKFCEMEGRLPAYPEEVPKVAVDYMASLVKVDPALFAKYSWRGRTVEYQRCLSTKITWGYMRGSIVLQKRLCSQIRSKIRFVQMWPSV